MSEEMHGSDRLSEYVDGELDAVERARLESHLEACPECTRELEEMRALVAEAASLPDLPPERDLWPDIASRLGPRTSPSADGADVLTLASRSRPRRIAFTVPQLLAASIALMLFSSAGAWLALGPEADRSAGTVAGGTTGSAGAAVEAEGSAVTPVAYTVYDEAIAELEEEFDLRRSELDVETIQVVERNLAIIDRAIAEAREALESDPSSGFLSTHLAEAMRRKVELLRRAASIDRTET
jgi:anti-sigma factor RsiW